jgi:hypothetical protein
LSRLAACCMTGQSESLPMMIPTSGWGIGTPVRYSLSALLEAAMLPIQTESG